MSVTTFIDTIYSLTNLFYKNYDDNTSQDDLFTDIYNKYGTQLLCENNDVLIDMFDKCEYYRQNMQNDVYVSTYKKEQYFYFGESMVVFEITTYIDNILESYKNNVNNILYQLQIDFNRTSIFINQHKIYSVELFKKIAAFYDKKFGKDYFFNTIFIMVCLQSSFAFPYEVLSEKYKSSMICSRNTRSDIFIDDNNNVDFVLNAWFEFNQKCKLHLVVSLYYDYEKNTFDKYGLISWTFSEL